MTFPLQITYRDVTQSDAIDSLVSKEAEKLGRYFDRILSCRVTIEHAHRRQRLGAPFLARIVVGVPGQDICVNQAGDVHDSIGPDDEMPARIQKRVQVDGAYKDPALAVRTAFRRARRKLQDYVRLLGEPASRY